MTVRPIQTACGYRWLNPPHSPPQVNMKMLSTEYISSLPLSWLDCFPRKRNSSQTPTPVCHLTPTSPKWHSLVSSSSGDAVTFYSQTQKKSSHKSHKAPYGFRWSFGAAATLFNAAETFFYRVSDEFSSQPVRCWWIAAAALTSYPLHCHR